MLIFKLLYLIKGYVVVRIDAKNFEKSLNLLQRKGIRMWDVVKTNDSVKFKTSLEDYKKYINIIDEIKGKAIKEKGVAFNFSKLKIRKGFAIGILILVVSLYIFTSMIWKIEVVGTSGILTKEILEVLEENKIEAPLSKSSINIKKVEKLIYNNFEEFKFVEVYLEGSNLIVFVKEKVLEPPNFKEDQPSSIISTKNGIINKIITKSGQAVVKEGDVVYEGQTLIMGIVKNKNSEDFVLVSSDGIVYAKTYYTFELKEEKKKTLTVSTNKSKSAYYLKINGKKVKIIGDNKPFENYNYNEKDIIPIELEKIANINVVKGIFYEEVIKTIDIDENSANNKMKISVYDDLLKKCSSDAKIIKSSMDYSSDEVSYYLRAQFEIIEDIGKKINIDLQNEGEEKE